MFAVRSESTWTGGDFYRSIRPLHLGTIGLVVFTLALADVLVGGLFGPEDFFENPATIVIWVDFWVGLGIVTALVGNAWDFVSPLSAAGRALERALAFRGAGALRYPERLGLWPATALVLLWSWMELVWDPAKRPLTLTIILLAYVALQTPAGRRTKSSTGAKRASVRATTVKSSPRASQTSVPNNAIATSCRAT